MTTDCRCVWPNHYETRQRVVKWKWGSGAGEWKGKKSKETEKWSANSCMNMDLCCCFSLWGA